ncbi:MAG: hypothetical protein ACI80K_000006 [Paracoccaceae bacterium]|jgi:hypothetical protein
MRPLKRGRVRILVHHQAARHAQVAEDRSRLAPPGPFAGLPTWRSQDRPGIDPARIAGELSPD